jgi:hypothetical protein
MPKEPRQVLKRGIAKEGNTSKRVRRSITKLAHGLYHTSRKDNMYYGASNLCPCCNEASETLAHIFTCPSPDVADNRKIQRAQ